MTKRTTKIPRGLYGPGGDGLLDANRITPAERALRPVLGCGTRTARVDLSGRPSASGRHRSGTRTAGRPMTGPQDGRFTDDHRRALGELERAKKPSG